MAQSQANRCAAATIPAAAGIGLRGPHFRDMLETRPPVGWLEVHSENYFADGGAPLQYLQDLRRDYPLSLHGVGMSLGSAEALDGGHLRRLQALIERVEPGLVSEHLSWSASGGVYLNDLLPLPYTEEALAHMVRRVLQAQEFLGRQLLIENPSSYLQYRHSTVAEHEFLAELSRQSGCGILLDVNNLYVSSRNHGWNAMEYLQALPPERIGEIHLAGHTLNRIGAAEILIDTHNRPVCAAVWALYRSALRLTGPKPVLIEWDADIPALDVLLDEAAKADNLLENDYVQAA